MCKKLKIPRFDQGTVTHNEIIFQCTGNYTDQMQHCNYIVYDPIVLPEQLWPTGTWRRCRVGVSIGSFGSCGSGLLSAFDYVAAQPNLSLVIASKVKERQNEDKHVSPWDEETRE